MYLVLTAMCAGPCRTLRMRHVHYTPRFSLDVLKTVICTCPSDPRDVCTTGYSTAYGARLVPGWVYRVGIQGVHTGYYPATWKAEH